MKKLFRSLWIGGSVLSAVVRYSIDSTTIMKLLVLTWTAAVAVAAVAQPASITHQITHEWSTNYLTYVPTVAVLPSLVTLSV